MRRQVLVLSVGIALAGCGRERRSAIVEMVRNSGAGDIRTTLPESIVQWFDKHPDVALKAYKMCQPVRLGAQADWPQTTEGRVCDAASKVAGDIIWQRELRIENDHKTFQGGSK